MRKLVSASMLAADKSKLIDELKRLEQNDVDLVHFDVMDNVFVPNTSFNDDTFSKIRKYSNLNFEIHLMVENPFDYINNYFYDENDVIIIHYESFSDEKEFLKCILQIKEHHKVGVSIKPATPIDVLLPYLSLLDYVLIMSVEPGFGGQKFMPSALEKINKLHQIKLDNDYGYVVEVDGGINDETSILCIENNIDILVSGSYLFKEDMKERVGKIRCEK